LRQFQMSKWRLSARSWTPFFAAVRVGDFDALVAVVLHPDAVLRAEAGPTRRGATRVIRGAPAVARSASVGAGPHTAATLAPALVNGAAGVIMIEGGQPFAVWDSRSRAEGSSKSMPSPTQNAFAGSVCRVFAEALDGSLSEVIAVVERVRRQSFDPVRDQVLAECNADERHTMLVRTRHASEGPGNC
jgi:hypothetical protein